MKQSDISERLNQCTDLMDLVMTANDLKMQGASETTVNKIMSSCRRKLLNKVSTVKMLKKVPIPEFNVQPSTTIGIEVKTLNNPVVYYVKGYISI